MGGLPMNRTKAALVIVIGTSLTACQRTPDQKAADANAQALEKRIAALEQQAPPSTGAPADPAALNLAPEAGSSYSTAPRAAAEQTAPAASRPAATTRRAVRTPRATASTSRPAARPAAEPVERLPAARS